MEVLNSIYDWQFITIFTTRDSRQKEFYKHTLDSTCFDQKAQSGEILFINECYRNFYGVSALDISLATNHVNKVWMLDFSLANQCQTQNLPNTKRIIVIPENEPQLVAQIYESNRSSREELIIDEYRRYYSNLNAGYNMTLDSLCIINMKNYLDESAEVVKKYILNEK